MTDKSAAQPVIGGKKQNMALGYILVLCAGIMWGTSDACGQFLFDNYPNFTSA